MAAFQSFCSRYFWCFTSGYRSSNIVGVIGIDHRRIDAFMGLAAQALVGLGKLSGRSGIGCYGAFCFATTFFPTFASSSEQDSGIGAGWVCFDHFSGDSQRLISNRSFSRRTRRFGRMGAGNFTRYDPAAAMEYTSDCFGAGLLSFIWFGFLGVGY